MIWPILIGWIANFYLVSKHYDMSGRPYARNPRAPYADFRDVEAILPHTFCIEAPLRLRDVKQEGIRRAIRRQCMQKNWRKMISIRHSRVNDEKRVEKVGEVIKAEEEQPPRSKDAEEKNKIVEAAKKELEALKLKLQELTDQKHVKFQLLKNILVDEARSKTLGGGGVAVSAPATKKRRVEFKEPTTAPYSTNVHAPTVSTEVGSTVSPGYNLSNNAEKP